MNHDQERILRFYRSGPLQELIQALDDDPTDSELMQNALANVAGHTMQAHRAINKLAEAMERQHETIGYMQQALAALLQHTQEKPR